MDIEIAHFQKQTSVVENFRRSGRNDSPVYFEPYDMTNRNVLTEGTYLSKYLAQFVLNLSHESAPFWTMVGQPFDLKALGLA